MRCISDEGGVFLMNSSLDPALAPHLQNDLGTKPIHNNWSVNVVGWGCVIWAPLSIRRISDLTQGSVAHLNQ